MQIAFRVRPERKARLLCDDLLQSSVHSLLDNEFHSYCHVFQVLSTECSTAKTHDFSTSEQRWKNEKEYTLLFDFLHVIIKILLFYYKYCLTTNSKKKKSKGEKMEDAGGRMNVDSGTWNIVLFCGKILLPSEIINGKWLLNAFPLQREKSSF